mgnify:CR=1 FL=1
MFFKNNLEENQNENFIKISALLIHAAKIDQEYSAKEEEIIKETLLKIGAEKNDLEKIISEAKKIEENSNQILEFTKEIKNLDKKSKIKIVEELWKIIYSDNNPDIYENNLMRRLTGLLYLDPKIVGDIKEKIKNNLVK